MGTRDGSPSTNQIFDSLDNCLELLKTTPSMETEASRQDEFHDLLEIVGTKHTKWLRKLWDRFDIKQEPLLADDGRVIFEPLFWYENNGMRFACPRDQVDVSKINNVTFFNVGQLLAEHVSG